MHENGSRTKPSPPFPAAVNQFVVLLTNTGSAAHISGFEFRNNIVAREPNAGGSSTDFPLFFNPIGVANSTTSNNLFWNHGVADIGHHGTSYNTGDPLFSFGIVTVAGGSYSIYCDTRFYKSGEVYDDGTSSVSGIVADDFTGTLRPLGSYYDIGAFEVK